MGLSGARIATFEFPESLTHLNQETCDIIRWQKLFRNIDFQSLVLDQGYLQVKLGGRLLKAESWSTGFNEPAPINLCCSGYFGLKTHQSKKVYNLYYNTF
jgi:hypothetical protein